MRAIQMMGHGSPSVLTLSDLPQPSPKEGEVLIRVQAAGVNRPDILQRKGYYPAPAGASEILGLEVAGEIVGGALAHPDNVYGLQTGDTVCALLSGGGYAEYAVAPIAQCLPIPKGLSVIEAASLPETFFTVWSNLFDSAHLGLNASGQPETVLIQGGSSGIGVTAIQIAHALGHPVFATARTPAKCAACEVLGAQRAICYTQEDFVEVIRAYTAGEGVDVILDIVGGAYIPRELDLLREGGRLVLIGLLGGARTELSLASLLTKRLTIMGSTLRARSVAFKTRIAAQLKQHIWPLLESGTIRPVVYQTYPAADAAQAHAMMEMGNHIGKFVLTW